MAPERRLAAILFTDIVGSTAVTARSESAGLALRDRHRELVRTQVERYHGRFIEAPGDESLSTFERLRREPRGHLALAHSSFVSDTLTGEKTNPDPPGIT